MSTLLSCVHRNNVAEFRSKAHVGGSDKRNPPKTETLLAVGRATEAENLPDF